MQDITAMKVPDKYEPKTPDEFGEFDRAMTRLLQVPAKEMQRKIKKHKERKKKAKSSERGPSRDSA